MHPNLLMDVIRRQAGTLAKSILEGVMNSIDAQATRCDITLDGNQLCIVDDGLGIAEKAHVEQFFETFGTPHAHEERKTFGTFRAGRGQLFSYGRNVWRTGAFTMEVDVAGRGLDYTLVEHRSKRVAGCQIEIALYDPLRPSDFATTERLVRQWCKYTPLTLSWNGELVSRDPEGEVWDHVLPKAYVRLAEHGSLAIYNLGIHPMELPGYRFGTGVLVMSRLPLRVNFARNDVQDSCPVLPKAATRLERRLTQKMLAEQDRQFAAEQSLAKLSASIGVANLKTTYKKSSGSMQASCA